MRLHTDNVLNQPTKSWHIRAHSDNFKASLPLVKMAYIKKQICPQKI